MSTSVSVFDSYEVVIGLECHVQLLTQTKLFSPARNHFGDQPNMNVDVVDLGLPGVLPVVNKRVIDFAIRLGVSLGCSIREKSTFARKHYFYPDLPKGYQISQYDEPICDGGSLTIPTSAGDKVIGITRIHIEEDAGKSIHVEGGASSFLDFSRAGTPLLEIVTEPDFRSAQEAMEAVKALRAIVTYLEICDGNMQEGSLRADVNVSVRKRGEDKFGTRTETKNLNSIRFLGQAIEFEFRRQVLELESGKSIRQETRLWDSNKKESRSLRSKEEAHDYRYFPDPDLLPVVVTHAEVRESRANRPELPQEKLHRFCNDLALTPYDAAVLTSDKALADYFERALSTHHNAKGIANWVINDVLRITKSTGEDSEGGSGIESCVISPETIAELVRLIDDKVISGKIGKLVFEQLLVHPEQTPLEIVERNGWKIEGGDEAIGAAVSYVMQNFGPEVTKFRAGKDQVFGFLMGQVMKHAKGKVDPEKARDALKNALTQLPQ